MGIFKKRSREVTLPIEHHGFLRSPQMLEHFNEEWYILFGLRTLGVDPFSNGDYAWKVIEPPRPDSGNIANANILSPRGITWRVTYAHFPDGSTRCTFHTHMVNPDPDSVQLDATEIQDGLNRTGGIV